MTVYRKETTEELRIRLGEQLRGHAEGLASDPQSNSVKRLAYDLSREVEDRTLAFRDIEALVKTLSDEAAVARARRLRTRSGLDRIDALRASVQATAKAKAAQGWEAFKRWAETPALGIVLTAHPTFSLSRDIRDVLGGIASSTDTPDSAVEALKTHAYLPKRAPTLLEEHEDTQGALVRIQTALDGLNRIVLDAAREAFPQQWSALTPHLADAYSWVGYDIDGRTDISWGDALRLRLQEKRDMIARYLAEAERLTAAGAALAPMAERLQDALQSAKRDLTLFETDLDEPENLVAAANNLTRRSDRRLLTTQPLTEAIDAAVAKLDDPALSTDLLILKARMSAFGLGTARIHFRVNARHITAAMRAAFGLTDATTDNRTLMARATERVQATEAKPINFASLALERSTAHEKAILAAQIHKYIDSDTPIRLLVAETEDALVPLGALYLAKLYGLEDHLDISPLFETSDALNKGGRIIGKMLENPAYRDYVQGRGLLAIQTGFSDAGRFMGQIPATLAIERVQSQFARELAKADLPGVAALVFNTHGEGLGRGGHPGTVGERVDYAMSPYAVAQFETRGLDLRHETSFQGGDGFLWFQTQALADATVLSLFEARFADRSEAEADPFYTERDFSWDLYRTLQNAQERLYADPDYVALLGGFGQNLLIPTGSRAAKRTKGAGGDTFDPRQLRAIPHNAILQQFGSPANLFHGVGRAASIDPERFDALLQKSARARSIFQMVQTTMGRTNLSILTGYGRLFDPGFWVSRALSGEEPRLAERCRVIADTLMTSPWRSQIMDLSNRLRLDILDMGGRFEADAESDVLVLLHALRLAVVMKMMIIATELPVVSDSETSRLSVLQKIQTLQIDRILADLRTRYPEHAPALDWTQALTEQTDDTAQGSGFRHISDDIVKPLSRARDLVRQITVAVTHHYDAFG